MHHLDAYRVEDPSELLIHGWDEMREDAVVAVEWGDRIEEILPAERLMVTFEHEGERSRRLKFEAFGAAAVALVESMKGE